MDQQRRLVLVVAIGLLPLVVLVALLSARTATETEAQITGERVTLARAAALVVDEFMTENVRALEILSRDAAALDDRDPARVSAYLSAVASANPNWDGVGLVDGRGLNITVTATTALRSVSIADRDYFQTAMTTGRTVVSQAVIGRFSGKPTVALAVPVTLASGDRGVLTGVLSLRFLQQQLNALPGAGAIEVVVVDRAGRAVVHPDEKVIAALTDFSALAGVRAALAGETGALRRPDAQGELLVAHAPVPTTGWGVMVRQPTSVAFALLRSELTQAAILTLLGVGFALAVAWVVGARLERFYGDAVAARQRAEAAGAESETARRGLETLVQQREAFLATLGHELRTPLTSISMASELLARRAAAGSLADVRRYAGLMREQVGRAADLISDLLDITRFDHGIPLDRERIALDALAREVLARESALLAADSRHEFRLTTAQAYVEGDERRLEQVLVNLLSNAVKYSPDGGRIDVRVTVEGECAVLAVADEGIGMTVDEVELIFAPFARTPGARQRGIAGTGLGLYLSKRIVEAHRGRIGVTSVPGQGTTVVVELPLAVGAPVAA